MIHYIKKEVLSPDEIECDICHKKFHIAEGKVISIEHKVGYYHDAFDDLEKIEIDICEKCLSDKLGQWVRVSNYNLG